MTRLRLIAVMLLAITGLTAAKKDSVDGRLATLEADLSWASALGANLAKANNNIAGDVTEKSVAEEKACRMKCCPAQFYFKGRKVKFCDITGFG